jgi:hypothetical protein
MEVSRRSIAGSDSALQKFERRFSLNSFWSFSSSREPAEPSAAQSRPENTVIHQRRSSLDSVVSQLTEDPLQPDGHLPSLQPITNPPMNFKPNSPFGGNEIRDSEEAYQMRHNSTTSTVVEPKTSNGSENISQILSFSGTVANMLLTQYPPVRPSPEQEQTEEEEFYNALEEHSAHESINVEDTAIEDVYKHKLFNSCKDIPVAVDLEAGSSLKVSSILGVGIQDSAIDDANKSAPQEDPHDDGPLRLELFLTGNKAQQRDSLLSQFLSLGRPNFKKSFEAMREEAMKKGEKRIAVCVCAPAIVVKLCKQACTEYSDQRVRFDFHSETFG